MVYTVRKWKRTKVPPKTIKTRSFKNFNQNSFLNSLNLIDWNEVLLDDDLDRACNKFNRIVNDILDIHAPLKLQKIKGNSPQWISEDLLKEIRERNFLKKKSFKIENLT